MGDSSPGRCAALLLVSTTLWGVSSAVLAKLGRADGTGATLLAAGGAATVTLVVLAGPARKELGRITSVRRHAAGLLLIGLLEAVNIGLYAAALASGPVPVIVALHLTSPVLLVVLAIMQGRRRADAPAMFQLLLVAGGIALFGMGPAETPGSAPILAGILATGSAAAVAGLIIAVSKLAPEVNADIAAAVQLTVAAAATSPLLLVAAPLDRIEAIALLGAGALFLGPGFAIYWRSLRGVKATTAGILGLNEVITASLFSAVLFGESISLLSVASGACVLAAIILEAGRPSRHHGAGTR